MSHLAQQVRAVLDDALRTQPDGPLFEQLTGIRRRFDEPLRVAIAGKVKAGKSTLLNALVGEELAPTDAGECTRIVTWYEDGVTYRVTVYPSDGAPEPVRFTRESGALEVDLAGRSPDDVDQLVVEWPSTALREITLIDTPGLESATVSASSRTWDFLAPDDERPTTADAVIYLMRHLHGEDVAFLEAFHDDIGTPAPVHALGVLSRADEVGCGRIDAMASAGRIAERYRRDPKVRQLCLTVVPVAGLLAQTGTTFTEAEFRAVRTLATCDPDVLDEALLSADRFLGAGTHDTLASATGLTPIEREHLLDRFGVFGVRLAVTLVRSGAAENAGALAAELLARSGIDDLRRLLNDQFANRRDLLKARSALVALEALLREAGGEADPRLAADVERVAANAHELVEMQLVQALRDGSVELRIDDVESAERLLGVSGTSMSARLGAPADATDEELRRRALEELARWQRLAEHPLSAKPVSEAARSLVRTCEGMVADTQSSGQR